MSATYAPPALVDPVVLAPHRTDDDPLVVAHAPTDTANCHTDIFLRAIHATCTVALMIQGRSHHDCIKLKARAHAGFDHLRGSFSVNTLENCALGLAPLVRLTTQHADRLEMEGYSTSSELSALFRIRDADGTDLVRELRRLDDNPLETRSRQTLARAWYVRNWRPEVVGPRLRALYEKL